jgi:hypothetical protein
MSRIDNTVESLTDSLNKSVENLQKLRNLRSEIGSKIIVEESWRRYLESQIDRLKRMDTVS